MTAALSGSRHRLLQPACRRWRQLRSYSSGDSGRNRLFLVFPAICCGLGTWQVYRRRWKLELIERLQQRIGQRPVAINEPVAGMLADLDSWEFTPVTVTGSFDHSRESLLGPRHLLDPEDPGEARRQGGGLFGSGERVGFHVVTPFRVAASGEWLLVNRGWVPARLAEPSARPQGQPAGQVTIGGLVRCSETSAWLAGAGQRQRQRQQQQQQQQQRRYMTRDLAAMSEELDTLPFLIDADAASSVEGGPIGGQTRVAMRNEHLSYVITWYTLAGLLALLWMFKIR